MDIRRLVTGNKPSGKSDFTDIGNAPRTNWYKHTPGTGVCLVWQTAPGDTAPNSGADRTPEVKSYVPGPGGTSFIILNLPPDSVVMDPSFDPAASFKELQDLNPGIAAAIAADPQGGGMHATPTVDYIVVIEGEIWALMDDGREERMVQGDVLVQNGTRHAWSNKSHKPARLACIMVGAPAP